MQAPKQLLFLMDTMTGGGAEKALLALLSNLSSDKYHITLILYLNKGIHLGAIPHHVEVKSIYPLGHKRWFEKVIFHSPLRHYYERSKLMGLIGENHYDAVISYMEGPGAALHSLILGHGKRDITWVHIDFAGCHWSRQFFSNDEQEKLFYNSVNDIVFVSHDAMNKFIYDVTTPKHCIYNIVDTDAIVRRSDEFAVDKRGFTVSFIGRLVPHKHPERLLQAISLLRQQGREVYGMILGEGEMDASLQELTAQLGLTGCVTFHGFQTNPYPFIKATDVLCITSDAEGLPIVVQEAMTLGTPIVSTRCAGMVEAIGDGCGVLCDNTAEAFADEIKRLMDDSTLRTQLATKARQRMAMFEPRAIISQIEQLIPNTDS